MLATMRCLLATNDTVVIVIGKKEKMLAPLRERGGEGKREEVDYRSSETDQIC